MASSCRGVPIPRVRACVRAWWADHGFGEHPAIVGKRVAFALLEQPTVEDRLAGVFMLHLLGAHLRSSDLAVFSRLFASGQLADPMIVDLFALKVLTALLDRPTGRRDVARALAQWRGAETTWQRRAACLAFIKLAAQGDDALAGLTDQILAMCATMVWSHESSDQTAVGCVLRELSRSETARVEAFFRRYGLLMSKECARLAVAKLPAALRGELLAHHRRVTSLQS